MPTIIFFIAAGFILWIGLVALAAVLTNKSDRKTLCHHKKALSRSLEIHAYLTLESRNEEHPLMRLRPSGRERQHLAKIVVELRRNLAECRADRAGELSRTWKLEEWFYTRIAGTIGNKRLEALDMLLHLHPSAVCAEKIRAIRLQSHSATFRQMLIAIYAKPSQVTYYLKKYPYMLSWQEVERVVEVLHMRTPILSPPKVDGIPGCNVDMFLLYLAHVEGVGNPQAEAEKLTHNPNRHLRTAAFNVLLGEAMYPPME